MATVLSLISVMPEEPAVVVIEDFLGDETASFLKLMALQVLSRATELMVSNPMDDIISQLQSRQRSLTILEVSFGYATHNLASS